MRKRNLPSFLSLLAFIGLITYLFFVSGCQRFEPEIFLEVSTDIIESLPDREYKFTGSIVSIGQEKIIQHGFCWSENNSPTIAGATTKLGQIDKKGSFTSTESEFSADTKYFVRAYATTEKETKYGEEKSFTTLQSTDPSLSSLDSISMGAGYTYEVFYSLENGTVLTSPRSAWDIAFSTDQMSVSILINEGFGVELYTYPKGDLTAWDAIDTSGISEWPAMFNSDSSWEYGAFNRNTLSGDAFDYGWGRYSATTHEVEGDSLFIIKNSNGDLMKLLIEKKSVMTNSYSIRYGGLYTVGNTVEISCNPYTTKNFIYYSLTGGGIIDIEPETSTWDLLFTKYWDESIPYVVTGVLTNKDRETAEVRNIDPSLADPANADFSYDISIIGSDWKRFDMSTMTYIIEPDLCYFVKKGEEIYKITFTGTDGSITGKIVFEKEWVE